MCGALEMSAMCQKRTLRHSFDHLVCDQLHEVESEGQRLGGLEVDDELELGRLHNWQVGRLLALQNLPV